MKKRVLILEDDQNLAQSLRCEFQDNGYEVTLANQIAEIPKPPKFDYAVLDIRLGGEFGLDAIEIIKSSCPHCRIVILSGYGSISTAVEAVKRGAVEYLIKPANFSMIEEAFLGLGEKSERDLKTPSLSQMEHEYIDFVLLKNQGNISKTAKALGLHRQSLQRKLKKYT